MTLPPPPNFPPPNLPPPPGPPTPGTPTTPSGSADGRTWRVALIAVLATVLVIGIVAVAFLIGRSGGDNSDQAARTATSEVSVTTVTSRPSTTLTTTTLAPATTPPPATPTTLGDPRNLQPGLFCRDLRARGFSYSASVDYWRTQGQPERLDADRDGIPCETVYRTSDVIAYWGTQGVTPDIRVTTVYGLPAGLMCRDLADRGFSVYEAIDYYLNWSGPSNMDADGNGIPCETVYPDAYDVWMYGFGD